MRRPRFIAEQARHAKGPLGRLIAFIMARETWGENERAIAALNIDPSDHVLDVGCGHGRSLTALSALTPNGRVAGADPSELMAEIAVQRNRKLVKARRVDVAIAGVEDLPFDDGAFDKALCVHVVYFWNDIEAAFGEIARVLKPGGRLALVFRTDADQAAVRAFPADVYRFRPITEVTAALEAAGLVVESTDPPRDDASVRPVLLLATKIKETEH